MWFQSQRTIYGKLIKQTKSGQAAVKLTFRQQWVLQNFGFLRHHLVVRTAHRTMGGLPVPLQSSQPSTFPTMNADEEEDEDEDDLATFVQPSATVSEAVVVVPSTSSSATATIVPKPAGKKKKGGKQADEYIRIIAENMSATSQMQQRVIMLLDFMKI